MRIAIDVKGNSVFFGIAHFHDIDAFEIDDLATDILYRGLPLLENEPENIIQTRLETLYEVLAFGDGHRLRFSFSHDLPAFLATVDLNGPLTDCAEFGPLHVWELDVIGKNIGTAQMTARERKKSPGCMNILHVEKGRA